MGKGKEEKTQWFNISLWNNYGKAMAEHLTKGKEVFVTGELTTRAYIDKNGDAQTALEIRDPKVSFSKGTTISFVGRLGADAETKTVGDKYVCEFRVGSNIYMGKDKDEHTNWYKVTLWEERAKAMVPHLVKGKEVFITGELVAKAYSTKEGEARVGLEIKEPKIQFMSGNKKEDEKKAS
jgi:single-stranded DNA-binding protein